MILHAIGYKWDNALEFLKALEIAGNLKLGWMGWYCIQLL